MMLVQYYRGCSVHQDDKISISTVEEDSYKTVRVIQYVGRITSTHVRDSISTSECMQYCGGRASVLWRISFSTCGSGG